MISRLKFVSVEGSRVLLAARGVEFAQMLGAAVDQPL